ncbi:hypothetical protein MHB40_14630 [Lysinibacillus sp. FSL K6-0057]|uniref:hypothetical protein n=1 Tax=Lysinibacillus sp. FSL K6-0057 TaxID=2921411 RepID=UPI00315AD0C9
MIKFPVISDKGNEYFIKIKKWIDGVDNGYSSIEVHIYKVERKLFSNKLVSLYLKTFKSNTPEFYDYVLASKNTVLEYEGSSSFILKENEIVSEKKFKQWDGVC